MSGSLQERMFHAFIIILFIPRDIFNASTSSLDIKRFDPEKSLISNHFLAHT